MGHSQLCSWALSRVLVRAGQAVETASELARKTQQIASNSHKVGKRLISFQSIYGFGGCTDRNIFLCITTSAVQSSCIDIVPNAQSLLELHSGERKLVNHGKALEPFSPFNPVSCTCDGSQSILVVLKGRTAFMTGTPAEHFAVFLISRCPRPNHFK